MATGGDSPLVLVTGASGYVASHVAKTLQEEGYKVRATVRNLEDESKVKALKNLCPEASHSIEIVEADLLNKKSWGPAVKDCSYVILSVCPLPPLLDPDDDVLNAANRTKNFLKACSEAGTVKRVVLTSSVAAIHGETVMEKGRVYTESDWTDKDSAYLDLDSKCKTAAERAAWDFVKELPEEKKFELAVINPGLVFGPVINRFVIFESDFNKAIPRGVEIIKRMVKFSMPMLPKANFAVCDVRDVAVAHLKAMTLPNAADHRHIICTQNVWLEDIALALSKEFEPHGYTLPSVGAFNFAVAQLSQFDKLHHAIFPRLGKVFRFDNKRMREELGITPRELNQTLIDTAYSLIENGFVKKAHKYKQNKGATDQTNATADENSSQLQKKKKL